jgi:hypothetical protein
VTKRKYWPAVIGPIRCLTERSDFLFPKIFKIILAYRSARAQLGDIGRNPSRLMLHGY